MWIVQPSHYCSSGFLLEWGEEAEEGKAVEEREKKGEEERETQRRIKAFSSLEVDSITSIHIPLARLSLWPHLTAREAGMWSLADAQWGGTQ